MTPMKNNFSTDYIFLVILYSIYIKDICRYGRDSNFFLKIGYQTSWYKYIKLRSLL